MTARCCRLPRPCGVTLGGGSRVLFCGGFIMMHTCLIGSGVAFLLMMSMAMTAVLAEGWDGDADIDVPDYELPDPLTTEDGRTIDSAEAWMNIRRPEVLELFRDQVYGRRPGPPDELTFETIEEDAEAMGGDATLRRIAVRSRVENREHTFELIVFIPNDAQRPVPLFLLMNNRGPQNTDATREERSGFWPAEEVIERGYGIAALQVRDLAPDSADRYTAGVIAMFEGERDDRPADAWMGLAAWGWGASRAMDYFETDEAIDASQIGLVGHSRGGKASLWAGAEDERFAMVVSNNSGCGGAAISRRRVGERLSQINNRFPHWFAENFSQYNGREHDLPLDQHMLIALIAPRVVYVASAGEDIWADPRGEFLSLAHASPVYGLFNHDAIDPEQMPPLDTPIHAGPRGYHIRSGRHNLTPYDWHRFMDLADEMRGITETN